MTEDGEFSERDSSDRELNEECGVIALYHLPNVPISPLCPAQGIDFVSRLAPRMLFDLQHRGQLSNGFSTYDPNRSCLIKTFKGIGSVAEVFHVNHLKTYEKIMTEYAGRAVIGHTRYAAGGREDPQNAQPFERPHIKKRKWFSFAYNGQLANYSELKERLLADSNVYLKHEADTEIFLQNLCAALKDGTTDLLTVGRRMTDLVDGAYCVVFLNAHGEMFLARDPRGFKPLLYAFDGSLFAAASEDVPLLNIGFPSTAVQSVEPGEMILVDAHGVTKKRFAPSSRVAHCFFEWIYFAGVAGTLDGKSVYLARQRLGEELAASETVPIGDDSIVVPVPDTAKAAADGMAYALGIPCLEGLIRNRYAGRTFIEGSGTRRRKAMTKYTPLPEVLEGKRLFLVEDSIVRSTTMRLLLERIREVGRPREIHVRVACPPIIAPCFYGIDMSSYGELYAARYLMKGGKCPTRWTIDAKGQAELAADLGADSLRYLSVDSISRAVGLPASDLCRACITNDYPTPAGTRMAQGALNDFLKTLASPQTD